MYKLPKIGPKNGPNCAAKFPVEWRPKMSPKIGPKSGTKTSPKIGPSPLNCHPVLEELLLGDARVDGGAVGSVDQFDLWLAFDNRLEMNRYKVTW